jgi:hypothetical protein
MRRRFYETIIHSDAGQIADLSPATKITPEKKSAGITSQLSA